MRRLLPVIGRLVAEGEQPVLCRVVGITGSTPRSLGDGMVVAGDRIFGSISGGCVDPGIFEQARQVARGGGGRRVRYGSPHDPFDVGLSCGGSLDLFVQILDDASPWIELAAGVARDDPLAIATRLEGTRIGETMLFAADGPSYATGIQDGDGGRSFVHVFPARPQMFVFGATDFGAAVARMGSFLGYRVTVADARSSFATPERIPDADEVVVGWPEDVLGDAVIDESSAVVTMTHDARFDVPALELGLRMGAGYVGALGSRRLHETRLDLLRGRGLEEHELMRIRTPVGLEIGARTPEEIAVAVAAEIVLVRSEPTNMPDRLEDLSVQGGAR